MGGTMTQSRTGLAVTLGNRARGMLPAVGRSNPRPWAIAAAALAFTIVTSTVHAQGDGDRDSRNPCESLVPAAIGGPLPRGDRLVLRWLGTSNYELSYRGQVLLLDTYYDRGPRNRPIGVLPDQVTRADAIFLGHGHGDHMSDAASIGKRLGIPIVGGPPTYDRLLEAGIPP